MMRHVLYLCFVTACFMSLPACAQSEEPIEITADDSLEWHRGKLYFKARKNVVAVQGATTLKSDSLTAKYKESKTSSMDIRTIEATGKVKILSGKSTAFGDKAIYDVKKGYAVMTGRDLKIVSDGQTVTAQSKFQYWVEKGRLEAIGDAVAIQEGDRLEADKIVTIFKEDKTGKRTLKELEAIGNVVITTPTEILTGNRATYNAETNMAELLESVKITRGENVLEGSRAQVNLETNVSKIFGGVIGEAGEDGRVRAVFYPESAKKPEVSNDNASDAPQAEQVE